MIAQEEKTDHPILFSAPMVRAIFDGSKTQTRRVVQPKRHGRDLCYLPESEFYADEAAAYFSDDRTSKHNWGWPWVVETDPITLGDLENWQLSPYGKVGHTLWVRETWAMCSRHTDLAKLYYRAHEGRSHTEFHKMIPGDQIADKYRPTWPKWKPAIHMPRWASRCDLRVDALRIERLQDITAADAIAEGIETRQGGFLNYHTGGTLVGPDRDALAVLSYRSLWESINGPESWNANPWVWVVGFDRTTPPLL